MVWVRFRDGIIVTTDPNDPSFLFGSDSKPLEDNPNGYHHSIRFKIKFNNTIDPILKLKWFDSIS